MPYGPARTNQVGKYREIKSDERNKKPTRTPRLVLVSHPMESLLLLLLAFEHLSVGHRFSQTYGIILAPLKRKKDATQIGDTYTISSCGLRRGAHAKF